MPLSLLEEKKPGLFEKLFKQVPRDNAVIRVNNLLAQSPDIRTVNELQVLGVCADISPAECASGFLDLYSRYAEHCLSDGFLSSYDNDCLAHLQRILGISDRDASETRERSAATVYRSYVQAALGDGYLDANEIATLAQARSNLGLADESATAIYTGVAKAVYQNVFDRAVSVGKFSPQLEEELRRLAENLRIGVQYDANTVAVLSRLRYIWELEEGQLPEVPVTINLQRGESCHAHVIADFHEVRRVTQSVSYGGVSTSVKLFKGVRLNGGSYHVSRRSKDVMTKVDTGDLYVTTKRVLFMGRHKNVTIRTAAILSVTQYSDGVEIEKGSGKNAFFLFSSDTIAFVKILQRVASEG
jgi:hypothetical protein